MKRNTTKEKHKKNKGYPYKSRIPFDFINKPGTYQVVVKRTREVLENYRNKNTAKDSLYKWRREVMEEVEIV